MTMTIYSHLLHDTCLFQMNYSLIFFVSCFLADICFSHYWCLNTACATMPLVCTMSLSKLYMTMGGQIAASDPHAARQHVLRGSTS